MYVWALGLSRETPVAPPDRAAGARTRQPENSKRAQLRVPALQTPPKFHERTPREGKKNENCGGRREKKARNFVPPPFGAPPFGAPPFGPPPFGAPLFLVLAPHPLGPHHDTHQIPKQIVQNWIGQNWIGQNWLWPKLAGPKPRWPKMDWPKLDWPKLVKSGWPKRDWPKSVPSTDQSLCAKLQVVDGNAKTLCS